MTHSELHMAIRTLLRGTPFAGFVVTVQSVERHPNRIAVEYIAQIDGISRAYRSADPARLLMWVRQAIKEVQFDQAPPAVLRAIGSAPRLRRVK
jgi:hypothetical protein